MLRRLEEALRAALEAPFAHLFPATVQPLEMAAALREALESSRVRTPEAAFAHNAYEVRLSLDDHRKLAVAVATLEQELAAYLQSLALVGGMVTGAAVSVMLAPDDGLAQGQIRCDSRFADRYGARLDGVSGRDVKGHTWPLGERTLIGRSAESDVRLSEPSVSRHHAEVVWDYVAYAVRDLGSQNGTHVGGQPVTYALLTDGDVLELGLVQLRFHVTPAREAVSPAG